MKAKIGWLSSGNGEGSFGLLRAVTDAIATSTLNAELTFIFCNREYKQSKQTDKFLDLAKRNCENLILLSSRDFKYTAKNTMERCIEYDKAVFERIGSFEVDFTVAAGYMIYAPFLCTKQTIINLHPALPNGPTGTWKKVIATTILEKHETSGAMVHIMSQELDRGVPLTYASYSTQQQGRLKKHWQAIDGITETELSPKIEQTELFAELREMQMVAERKLLVETLNKVVEKGIFSITNNCSLPIDLSDIITKSLALSCKIQTRN